MKSPSAIISRSPCIFRCWPTTSPPCGPTWNVKTMPVTATRPTHVIGAKTAQHGGHMDQFRVLSLQIHACHAYKAACHGQEIQGADISERSFCPFRNISIPIPNLVRFLSPAC